MYHMGNVEIQLLTGSCEVQWGRAVVTTLDNTKIGHYREPRKTGDPARKREKRNSKNKELQGFPDVLIPLLI